MFAPSRTLRRLSAYHWLPIQIASAPSFKSEVTTGLDLVLWARRTGGTANKKINKDVNDITDEELMDILSANAK
jgi:hypothetical protein